MLKKVLFFLCLSFLFNEASAQFGLTGGYRFNEPSQWVLEDDLSVEGPGLLGNGPTIGLDYWFRLKNYRVEFMPELNYSRFTATPVAQLETQLDAYSFFFNVHFYWLDFLGDCDCPTFSKAGNSLEKGFFLRLSPGISWLQQAYVLNDQRRETNTWAPSLGAGAGFDFGLSDLVTVSPLVELRYFPSVAWSGLKAIDDPLSGLEVAGETGNLLQVMAGLRLGFRLDYR